MINNFISGKVRSIYTQEDISVVNILGYSLVVFLILSFGIHAAVISVRSDIFNSYLDNNFSRAEQLQFQVHKTLELSQEISSVPCSDEDLARLKEIKRVYFFIDDLGRTSNNGIICSAQDGILDSLVEFPASDAVTLNGAKYWNSQTDLILNEHHRPIVTFKDSFLYISPSFLYLTKHGYFHVKGLGGIAYIKGDKPFVYSYFGEVLPRQLDTIFSHKASLLDWLPLPDRFITKTKCSELNSICITVVDSGLGFFGMSQGKNIIVFLFLISISFVVGISIDYLRGKRPSNHTYALVG